MAAFNHAKVSFQAGELSPRLHGRVDTELYGKGVARLDNMMPTPQGSVRLRQGSQKVEDIPFDAGLPRLFVLRDAAGYEDQVVSINATRARVYTGSSGRVSWRPNLVTNGHFDASSTGWTPTGSTLNQLWVDGHYEMDETNILPPTYRITQSVSLVSGRSYQLSLRFRRSAAVAVISYLWIDLNGTVLGTPSSTTEWVTYTVAFTGPSTGSLPLTLGAVGTSGGRIWVDNVLLMDLTTAAVAEFSGSMPWADYQLASIQSSPEPSRNKVYFSQGGVQPQTLYSLGYGHLALEAQTFNGQPPSWGGYNWPRVVEAGFQGRLWFASTANDPHNIWASRAGVPTDFTLATGAPVASDAIAFQLSAKGAIEWMQGQRVLLAGSQHGEHAVQEAGGGVIVAPSPSVLDVSAFGSAARQACFIGDQVLYVTHDKRHVRSLDYSWEKQNWYSRDITWVAEHIIDSDIAELHFARSPDPLIIAVLESGELRMCTYDRAENVAAWWRFNMIGPVNDGIQIVPGPTGTVHSAVVARGPYGDELWMAVTRGTTGSIERLPLYERTPYFLDGRIIFGPAPAVADTNLLYYASAPGVPSWTVGATWSLADVVNTFFLSGLIGFDIVFHAGGRLRVQATAPNRLSGTIVVVETPSASVQAALTTLPATLAGGVDWHLEIPSMLSYPEPYHFGFSPITVLLDGQVVASELYQSAGELSIPRTPGTDAIREGSYVAIGVPIPARCRTLPIEGGLNSGSSQTAKRRQLRVRLRLHDSAIPTVNGYRAAERLPADPMNTGTDLVTGDVDVQLLGWEENGVLDLVPDIPLRTEVLAIFSNAKVNEV